MLRTLRIVALLLLCMGLVGAAPSCFQYTGSAWEQCTGLRYSGSAWVALSGTSTPPEPEPLLDDFNRTDAATLGANWTVLAGSVGISSNRAAFTDAGFTAALWNVDSFAADQDVFCTVAVKPTTNNTSSVGVLARFDTALGNGYLLTAVPQSGTDTIRFWRVTGGAATQLGADILAEYAVGNRIKLSIEGTTLSAYLDTGSGWALLGTRTDATYTSGGLIGIYGVATTGAVDDFGGGNHVAP